MPSNLSSTYTVGAGAVVASLPDSGAKRAQIASAVGSGLASMHLIGRNKESSARCNSPFTARSAVSPMSPRSMFASFTSSSGTSKADAMASSTRPSRKPIRRSPVKILTTYCPSRAEIFARRDWRISALLSGPRDFCSDSKNSRDWLSVKGSGTVRPSSASNAVFPASPWELAMRRNSASVSLLAPIRAR